ncbi:hypothetical protein CPB83DRAFT_489334 [Crepidotus variabilis]|uniref:Uncharacterized protein n=1 Tax=Crepidotus variabilis TaxID=179855 RepID=A0A9P6EPL8_9AGAR|nr:hypothetical protein CPB83DRAFT_489334 [Crepidotus variabilis]
MNLCIRDTYSTHLTSDLRNVSVIELPLSISISQISAKLKEPLSDPDFWSRSPALKLAQWRIDRSFLPHYPLVFSALLVPIPVILSKSHRGPMDLLG